MDIQDPVAVSSGRSYADAVVDPPQRLHRIDNADRVTVRWEFNITVPKNKEPSNPSLKPVTIDTWSFTKFENPLKGTHNMEMFCAECFQGSLSHTKCLKNILAFAEKGTSDWLQVRERKKENTFNGHFVLCKSVWADRDPCRFGRQCLFAHNTIERLLWNADKDNKFNLSEFINTRSNVTEKISEFVRQYGTSFSHICRACYKASRLIVHKSEDANTCNGREAHNWTSNKTLFYAIEKRLINRVLRNISFYKECFKWNCSQKCSRAHSTIERKIWMLLRDLAITEEKFIEKLDTFSNLSMVRNDSEHDVIGTPCPYKLLPICGRCGKDYPSIPDKRCTHWRISSIVYHLTTPGHKLIKKLPHAIPKDYKFAICKSSKNGICEYESRCSFAHSQEEIYVWRWMCFNKIKDLKEIIPYQENQSTAIYKGTSSIVQDWPLPAAKELPAPHYCQFCGMSCRNQTEWENHCTTNEHKRNVSHDKEQQWNYRKPPLDHQNENNLQLCEKHAKGQCLYSNSLDMYNWCPYAHGNKELEEWKKRLEWCALKSDLAQNTQMSYILELQNICVSSPQIFHKMSENIPDVKLEMNGEKKAISMEKKFSHTWTITVTSRKKELQKVSLLHDKDRLYFTLETNGDKSNFQVLDAHHCKQEGKINHWSVTINFNSNMYGTFSQRVIFDFGDKPLLFQDLTVDMGAYKELLQLLTIRDENKCLVWTPENREIIFLPRTIHLMNKYKRPANIEDVLSHDVITTELNRHNYVQKMHKLLFLEEFACHQKMARYNLRADMVVSETIRDMRVRLNCEAGTLFGELHLSNELSEDTDIGQLMLTSCSSVYIALPLVSSKVYEVEIVKEDKVNFKGQQRNSIYLVLTTSCIQDLRLIPGVYQDVELQFQLNRQPFYLMHFALDNMDSIDIVFPDPVKNVFSLKTKPTKCSSKVLNKEQLIAVKYIVGQRENFLCPFILNGAYGTGKTETLAQATMQLLDTQPDARILICTQCNSSADLFILKHFDEYMMDREDRNMLRRIYYSGRRVESVPYEVRKYTLMSPKQDKFRKPRKSDFADVRVVICTLENCHRLIRLQLKGMFTHIFIDEAAQEFEAKVLLPLTLATKNTCVVLSGDHHQMGVKVHSAEAQRQGLGISIMQRLFEHYANHPHQNVNADSPLHTLLVHNYRSVKEISQFISTCFYGNVTNPQEDKIPPYVSDLKPLQFHAVFGLDASHNNSTSYHNAREALQVIKCVVDMSSNWPKVLGSFNPRSICVVSSYKDQVNLIRRGLRNQCVLLGQVVVEQVGNMPGKEFDVVIISTVRTSKSFHKQTNDFDFFVDKKLLNTAMTRAKYSVIVVGDPVALCAYGKCFLIWRFFMHRCSQLCSVQPPEITYDDVKIKVNDLLWEKVIQPVDVTYWPPSQLQTGFNFPTESSIWSFPNPLNNQEIHKNDAYDLNIGGGDSNDWNLHSVSPNPIQQVPIEDSMLNIPSPDIDQVDHRTSLEIDPVDSEPKYQDYADDLDIAHVLGDSNDWNLHSVSPNPIQQVPIEDSMLNIPSPDIDQVDPDHRTSLEIDPVDSEPKYQDGADDLNIAHILGDSNDWNLHSVSPNPIQQVPIEDSMLNIPSPDIDQVDPDHRTSLEIDPVDSEPKYQDGADDLNIAHILGDSNDWNLHSVSPNPIQQVPIEDSMLNIPSPDIDQVHPDHRTSLEIDPVDSEPKYQDNADDLNIAHCFGDANDWNSHSVSPNPIQQVPVEDSMLNNILLQEVLIVDIHKLLNPINIERIQKVTKNPTETFAAKATFMQIHANAETFSSICAAEMPSTLVRNIPSQQLKLVKYSGCLQTEDLIPKIKVVRISDVSDESQPACTSQNKIFQNEPLIEETNLFEIKNQSLCEKDFKQQIPSSSKGASFITRLRSVFSSIPIWATHLFFCILILIGVGLFLYFSYTSAVKEDPRMMTANNAVTYCVTHNGQCQF